MHEQALRTVVIKAVMAAALLGVAWSFTARPARAEHTDAARRLEDQTRAIQRFRQDTPDPEHTRAVLAEVTRRAHALDEALGRHPNTAAVFTAIDEAANRCGVRIVRTDPKSSGRSLDAAGARVRVPLVSDAFLIDFQGPFPGAIAFIDALRHDLGVAHVSDLRLSRADNDAVRASITLTVFRVPAGASILPDDAEPAHAD